MKTKWFMPIGAALMVAGLAFANPETPANTQTPSQAAPHHRSANRQQWMQQRFDRMANYLNLTDAQKTQAKSIMQQSRQSTANVRTQLEQNRAALKQAIKADKTSEIDRLSKEQGRLMGQMIAAHTEAWAKIYQQLTPDQRAKADQLPEHFRAMRHEHMQNRKQS